MLQKKYEDYLKEVYKLFPDIEETSIKEIIEYGLKKMHYYIKKGNEIFLRGKSSLLFIGAGEKESAKQLVNSTIKEHTKYRRLFLDKKQPWDGFYYFGLTEEENNNFIDNKKIVDLYKLMNECAIRTGIKYIYRIKPSEIEIQKMSWRETKEVIFSEAELSKEGMKKLKKRANKAIKNQIQDKE